MAGVRRRVSRRLSDALDIVTERKPDLEEDPEFLARNPTWEDQLPLLGAAAAAKPVLDLEKQKTAAALRAALVNLPRVADSLVQQNWKRGYKAVKRFLVTRKKARQSPVGTGARLEGHALGRWSPHSPARLRLFSLLYNQKTEYLLLFLIGSHLLVLIFQVQVGTRAQRWTNVRHFTIDFLDGFITALYTIEMLLRMACLGLYKERHTYLRNPYNRLDFVIVLDSWIHIIVRSATGKDYFARIAVFRAFRALLALKHIGFFADIVAIMAAVKRSVSPLQNVILLTFFLLVFYALLGTQFLQKTMSSRCVMKVGGRVAYPARFCDKKVLDAYTCPSNQKCALIGNPNWGSTSFDIFYVSLLTMFQIVSVEGWSLIMYNVKDSEGERANSYFMTLVVIGTYFLFNVFIAGISGVFLRVRAEHRALLKKARQSETSFYHATVMANILKDDIVRDDSQVSWYENLFNKTSQAGKSVVRSLSRTSSSMKSALQSPSAKFSRMSSQNRSLSRSMSMGVQAAVNIHQQARGIVEHPRFDMWVVFTVTANAVVLSIDHYGISHELHIVLRAFQGVLLVTFGVELVLRFLASGPVTFFGDRINLVDILVVAVSAPAVISGAYPNISAVRVLRWFWFSKKHVDRNPTVVATCMRSVGSLFGVFFFYLFIIVIMSIISMELFSGQYYKFPDGYPRGNHDSMLQTMLLWFTVTTSESWPNQMWNSMRPGVEYNGVAAFLYIFYLVLTSQIVMNLIIAILLERTELNDNEKKQIQRMEHMKMMSRTQSRAYTRSASWVVGAVEGIKAGFLGMTVRPMKSRSVGSQRNRGRELKEDTQAGPQLPGQVYNETENPVLASGGGVTEPETATSQGSVAGKRRRSSQILEATGFPANIGERRGSRTALEDAVITLAETSEPSLVDDTSAPAPSGLQKSPSRSTSWGRSLSRKASAKKESFQLSDYEDFEKQLTKAVERPWYLKEGSLLIFGEHSNTRRKCKRIIQSKYYWRWIIFWTTVSTWLVAERQASGKPIKSKHFPQDLIRILDGVVFGVFSADFAIKTIAGGLIFSPDALLSDWYSILDLFILVIDGVHLATWHEDSLRAVDAMLALRPFRFVVRIQGLRTLLSNLVTTLPAIVSVLFFTSAIFLIFATIGVQQFKGRLWYCNDPDITHRVYCTGLYYDPVSAILSPRVWVNQPFHFDDIGNAMLSLFICSSFDNWVTNWLYPVMDITGQDRQPARNKSPANGLYFVAFCCVGGFFIVRVFIGVFINEFGRNSGTLLLTERQKLWRDMNRIIQKTAPVALSRPQTGIRKYCFYLIRHRIYKSTMIVALLGYSLFLATNKAGQPLYISTRRQKGHVAITSYFLLESITKFLGDEWRVYKYEYAKHMEFGVSLMAASGLMGVKGTIRGYVGRTAYITRVFCILPHIPKARVIMRTMFICFPKVAEIMALLAIFLFAFAGIGFQMFSHLKDGTCIGPTVNFRSFVNSFVTVFQVTTLDNWSCIMKDATLGPPMCTEGGTMFTNNCGFPIGSLLYFSALILVASYIFMNLFVAVILDAITFGIMNENSMVAPEHLQAFRTLWSQERFDPEATGFIGLHKLRWFVDSLGIPLGRRHNSLTAWYVRIEYEVFSFRVPNKGVPFKQLLETLTLYKIGPTGLPLTLRIEREKRIQDVYLNGAATKIAALARGFLTRRRVAKGKLPLALEETKPEEMRTELKGALMIE